MLALGQHEKIQSYHLILVYTSRKLAIKYLAFDTARRPCYFWASDQVQTISMPRHLIIFWPAAVAFKFSFRACTSSASEWIDNKITCFLLSLQQQQHRDLSKGAGSLLKTASVIVQRPRGSIASNQANYLDCCDCHSDDKRRNVSVTRVLTRFCARVSVSLCSWPLLSKFMAGATGARVHTKLWLRGLSPERERESEYNECTRSLARSRKRCIANIIKRRQIESLLAVLSASACVVGLEISAPVLLKFVLHVNLTMGARAPLLVLRDVYILFIYLGQSDIVCGGLPHPCLFIWSVLSQKPVVLITAKIARESGRLIAYYSSDIGSHSKKLHSQKNFKEKKLCFNCSPLLRAWETRGIMWRK